MRGVSHKAVPVPPNAGEVLGGLSMAEIPGAPFTGDVLRKQAHTPPGTEAAELGLLGEVTNGRPGGGVGGEVVGERKHQDLWVGVETGWEAQSPAAWSRGTCVSGWLWVSVWLACQDV